MGTTLVLELRRRWRLHAHEIQRRQYHTDHLQYSGSITRCDTVTTAFLDFDASYSMYLHVREARRKRLTGMRTPLGATLCINILHSHTNGCQNEVNGTHSAGNTIAHVTSTSSSVFDKRAFATRSSGSEVYGLEASLTVRQLTSKDNMAMKFMILHTLIMSSRKIYETERPKSV